MNAPEPRFAFDNSYARELEGCYVAWNGAVAPKPEIVRLNASLARELGLDPAALNTPAGARILTGSETPAGGAPLAQAYAGHQFGGFSPQLGDGRALLVGELIDQNGRRRDLHLKGSGPTPFSRRGDGKAALGPVLREYLIGEAMHALGIPTTRALAASLTGEVVMREEPMPGAVLARVAASHLRVGTFEYFAARGETALLKRLADYAIARHDPELAAREDRYLGLLANVGRRQARLVARWMHVGFVHGVMNTDNMTLSGETIDYGPCAFMDIYHPRTVFSSIDTMGRYAYGNQPGIAQWNLSRLAEALLPLIHADEARAIELAKTEIDAFMGHYQTAWLAGLRDKLGWMGDEGERDLARVYALFAALNGQGVDYTGFFRDLAWAAVGETQRVLARFANPDVIRPWLESWRARAESDGRDPGARALAMNRVNPLYIPRNHKVEEALMAAVTRGDLGPFDRLLAVLAHPFEERDGLQDYAAPAPPGSEAYITFCGT